MAETPILDSSTPSECTNFLEFADSLNIPINQEYLEHVRLQLGAEDDSSFLDVGVKDSKLKGHEHFNERRIQNALWRAWWRQRRARFNTGPQHLPLQDDLESMADFVFGYEIGDIPTGYKVQNLEHHELPVIGTYVDPHVLPGFRYRIRVCDAKEDEYLFEGNPLRLVRVGAGYGKRLTFEDEDILSNENFFWSDSNPDGGYAFSIDCLSKGERFKVFDNSLPTGEAVITQVDSKQQIMSSQIHKSGTTLHIRVSFESVLIRQDKDSGSTLEETISVTGTAIVTKPLKSKIATCAEITEVNIPGMKANCILRKCLKFFEFSKCTEICCL